MPPAKLRAGFPQCQSPRNSLQRSLHIFKMMLKLLNLDYEASPKMELELVPTYLEAQPLHFPLALLCIPHKPFSPPPLHRVGLGNKSYWKLS